MPALRPRRRAAPDEPPTPKNTSQGGTSSSFASSTIMDDSEMILQAPTDSEEFREPANVLVSMMTSSSSKSRSTAAAASNIDEAPVEQQKLSDIIDSVVKSAEKEKQEKQMQESPSTRPKRQASIRKTPFAGAPVPKTPKTADSPKKTAAVRRKLMVAAAEAPPPPAPNESPLRRSRRRTKISVEVTVTASDDEEVGDDETEIAADYFARQNSMDMADDGDGTFDSSAFGLAYKPFPAPAPTFCEMTPQLLESLMAPVGLFQSPSDDGHDKELRLRMPVDYGGGCVGVCDVLFNEHLGIKIDGTTDWMPVNFVGDYLDPESLQIPDTGFVEKEDTFSRHGRSGNRMASVNPVGCKEEFDRIAAILDMNSWMNKVVRQSSLSDWLSEHDYAEPMIKFGRPRSANILQDAVSAFNKYVNFIRLSERREPFLYGLWWEKEDALADYWLLPKVKEEDADYDRRQLLLVIPIANEWTEEVVVSSEETVDSNGLNGSVTPMTFWDNRGFLSLASLGNTFNDSADYSDNDPFGTMEQSPYKRSTEPKNRKRTTATPVARAPRFMAPKLDPSLALVNEGKLNENGMPENFDEIVNAFQNQYIEGENNAGRPGGSGTAAAARAANASATGSQTKNMSKEKLEEIDYAMRCIKELQQRRHTGPCRLHCKICSREFTAPTSLIVHYRSHAGIKPFTCPICLTSFTRRHSLKYHMLCHSGQARFRCSLCDRLFRHSGHYRDHMRKHENGMPFSCAECNRVFATRTTYRRHMSVVHNAGEAPKGKGRRVGVSKMYADMDMDVLEAGELGEVAEEIEYEADDDELDSYIAEEIVHG